MLLPVSCGSSYPSVPQKPCWAFTSPSASLACPCWSEDGANEELLFWFLFLPLSYYIQMRCPSLLYSSCSKAKLKCTFCGAKHFPKSSRSVWAQQLQALFSHLWVTPFTWARFSAPYFLLLPTSFPIVLNHKVDLAIYLPAYLFMKLSYASSLQKSREKENNHPSLKHYNHHSHRVVFLFTFFHSSSLFPVMMMT